MIKNADPVLAANVITELGGTVNVARLLQINKASVSAWKRKGIPRAREMYFRVAFPYLKAWNYKQA